MWCTERAAVFLAAAAALTPADEAPPDEPAPDELLPSDGAEVPDGVPLYAGGRNIAGRQSAKANTEAAK